MGGHRGGKRRKDAKRLGERWEEEKKREFQRGNYLEFKCVMLVEVVMIVMMVMICSSPLSLFFLFQLF